MAANKLRRQLLQDVQDVLNRHEDDGTTDSSEYEEAVMEFFERHLCKVRPMPEEVVSMFDNIKRDPTIYHTVFDFLFHRDLNVRLTGNPGMDRQNFTLLAR